MTGVREGNTEFVRVALDSGGLKPEKLTVALAAASTGDNKSGDNKNAEIAEMLKKAGAVPPPEVDPEILQSYVSKYRSEQGLEVNVTVKDGKLLVIPAGQQPLSLMAVDGSMSKAYVHGYDPREALRLEDQATTLVELLHSDTAYPEGHTVLEAGCGVGAPNNYLGT